ncbi:MAG: hypothetical protein V8R75_02600 [Oscillospiraceae bacterium]
MGVVGTPVGDRLKVLGIEMEERKNHAMMDGQIDKYPAGRRIWHLAYDGKAEKTAENTMWKRSVWQQLDVRCGLKAEPSHWSSDSQPIAAEQISQLETGAVSAAEAALQRWIRGVRPVLVGYTVAQYRLDRYPLSTLLGHGGRTIEADVVATFLPGEVVESLYAAMHFAGLQVAGVTLEPVSAMNAAIPAKFTGF